AKSKKPKVPTPAASSDPLAIKFVGDPIKVIAPPRLDAKAKEIKSLVRLTPVYIATERTIGISAAATPKLGSTVDIAAAINITMRIIDFSPLPYFLLRL